MPVPSPFVSICRDPCLDLLVGEPIDLEDLHAGTDPRAQRHGASREAEAIGDEPPSLLGGAPLDRRRGDANHHVAVSSFQTGPSGPRLDPDGERGHVV